MKRDEVLAEALKTLRAGGTILYPTDTVWGLGCDATNPEAVAKIYAIKRRSEAKSLVLLAADLDMVAKYVRQVPSMAVELVEVNDKPMTIIYPEAQAGVEGEPGDRWHLAWNAVAEDDSVGMRIPLFDFCRDLAFKLGRPVVLHPRTSPASPRPPVSAKSRRRSRTPSISSSRPPSTPTPPAKPPRSSRSAWTARSRSSGCNPLSFRAKSRNLFVPQVHRRRGQDRGGLRAQA